MSETEKLRLYFPPVPPTNSAGTGMRILYYGGIISLKGSYTLIIQTHLLEKGKETWEPLQSSVSWGNPSCCYYIKFREYPEMLSPYIFYCNGPNVTPFISITYKFIHEKYWEMWFFGFFSYMRVDVWKMLHLSNSTYMRDYMYKKVRTRSSRCPPSQRWWTRLSY